ncbi:MAG: CaiB/BaiF CoA-transferase family protein [Pseudomonadota bacterium]
MSNDQTPLDGLKVVELSHMVMGPSIGLLLGDLGADVVKVEPPGGDKTRRLRGSGAGYFAMYNRNKRSITVDVKSPEGLALVKKLTANADILIENFRSGTMDRLGLSYETLSADNPRLIYCSARGFLSGPYEQRTALDEVAQMMGGLAYMTGPPGRPLRAGASVIDVAGGMFGVIAVLSAVEQRHRTGKGQHLTSALFETTAFLVGQHMAQKAVTGVAAQPMPVRISAWAVYDIFDTADESQVFVAVVSDGQWQKFCAHFEITEFSEDRSLDENAARVAARDKILPRVREVLGAYDKEALMEELGKIGLPYAPVSKPEELFDDPHLNAEGGLVDIAIPDGEQTRLPALPIQMDGRRLGRRLDVPQIGEHTDSVLREAGLTDDDIATLRAKGVIG